MKKVGLAVCLALLASSFCFAQETKTSYGKDLSLFAGKVVQITAGNKAALYVTNTAGTGMWFRIKSDSRISDAQGKPLSFDTIKAGDNVSITYTKGRVLEGTNQQLIATREVVLVDVNVPKPEPPVVAAPAEPAMTTAQ